MPPSSEQSPPGPRPGEGTMTCRHCCLVLPPSQTDRRHGEHEIASFMDERTARYVADLHNAQIARSSNT